MDDCPHYGAAGWCHRHGDYCVYYNSVCSYNNPPAPAQVSWFTGYKKYSYPEGGRYEGYFVNGERSGKGTFYYVTKDRYEGDWKDNYEHGQGTLFYHSPQQKYIGSFVKGKFEGQGAFFHADGAVYRGQWKNGERSGQGKIVYANGDTYEGEWKAGKRQGQGSLIYKNRNVFVGEFEDGWQVNGRMQYAIGDVYVGQWHKGKRHGQGVFESKSGVVQKGIWKDDVLVTPMDNLTTAPTTAVDSSQDKALERFYIFEPILGGTEYSVRPAPEIKTQIHIVIPSSYKGKPVTTIKFIPGFECWIKLETVVIPKSITTIGTYGFAQCDYVKFYCEAEQKPAGWAVSWRTRDTIPVVWGYKRK